MEREKQSVDRRVRKTKRAIRNALAKLMTEKDITDITIKDIVTLADINRKTFYNYYSGVYQVVEEIERTVLNDFYTAFEDLHFDWISANPNLMFDRINKIVLNDPELYTCLLLIDEKVNLITKIATVLIQSAKRDMRKYLDLEDDQIEMLLDFTFAGTIRVYQNWVASEKKRPLNEIVHEIVIISFGGISRINDMYGRKNAEE